MTTKLEDTTEGYDKREARLVHAIASHRFEPSTEAAHAEARKLATAIESLDLEVSSIRADVGKSHGNLFQVEKTSIRGINWPTLKVADRVEVIIHFERGDLVLSGRREGVEVGTLAIPDLCFNPIANRFEGTKCDTFIVQEPGQPCAKRAALAVVMEAAAKYLGEILAHKEAK